MTHRITINFGSQFQKARITVDWSHVLTLSIMVAEEEEEVSSPHPSGPGMQSAWQKLGVG